MLFCCLAKVRKEMEAAYDFEDYRAKVSRYVNENGNVLAVYKLTHTIPLARGDYQEMERVLTSEPGGKEDYGRESGIRLLACCSARLTR